MRFWNAMPMETPAGGAEERVLLADDLAPQLREVEDQDPARVGSGERHPLLGRRPWP